MVISTLLACGGLNSAALAAAEKAPQIEAFYPTQVLRGETTEITVRGKHFTAIKSVEVTPSEGVSVQTIKENEAKAKEKEWRVVLVVGQDAQPGDRSVVVVTPEGRLAARTIRIPNHIPQIVEVKILSTDRREGAVEFEASVFDNAADLGPKPKVLFTMFCERSPYEQGHRPLWPGRQKARDAFIRTSTPVYVAATTPDKVTTTDSTNSLVHVSFNPSGHLHRKETCEMQATIMDQNGNESMIVSTPVEFK